MRSRPILFSAPMVRALLDGSKTQTRRVCKLTDSGRLRAPGSYMNWHPHDRNCTKACPYGQPGDQLWVRETFQQGGPDKDWWYRADMDAGKIEQCKRLGWNWKPSIFMPRSASRLTLEITEVRVERLQEISETDAMAEGIILPEFARQAAIRHCELQGIQNPRPAAATYKELWDSINAEKGPGEHGYSWAGNPLVWVLEFRKLS